MRLLRNHDDWRELWRECGLTRRPTIGDRTKTLVMRELSERLRPIFDQNPDLIYHKEGDSLFAMWVNIDPGCLREKLNSRFSSNPEDCARFLPLVKTANIAGYYFICEQIIDEVLSPMVLVRALEECLASGVALSDLALARQIIASYRSPGKTPQ